MCGGGRRESSKGKTSFSTDEMTEESTNPETGGNPSSLQNALRKGGEAQTQVHLQGEGYMLSSVVNKAIHSPFPGTKHSNIHIKFNPHRKCE